MLGDIFHLLRFMVANESERICPFVPVELKMSGSVTFVPSLSRVTHGAEINTVSFRSNPGGSASSKQQSRPKHIFEDENNPLIP